MKVLFLCALFILINSSWAQNSKDFENFRNNIRELKNTIENLPIVTKIEINADKDISIPDYDKEYDLFLEQTEVARKDFKKTLLDIEERVEDVIGGYYSELAIWEENLEKNPQESHWIKPTIETLKNKIKEGTNDLTRELNEKYQEALRRLISVNERLVYRTYKGPHAGNLLIFGLAAVAGGFVYGNFAIAKAISPEAWWLVFLFGEVAPGFVLAESEDNIFEKAVNFIDNKDTFRLRIKDNFKGKISDRSYADEGQSLFGMCQTQACAIRMGVHFAEWQSNTLELNKNINLVKGIKLKNIKHVNKRKASRKLMKMAKLQANTLKETAVYTEHKEIQEN